MVCKKNQQYFNPVGNFTTINFINNARKKNVKNKEEKNRVGQFQIKSTLKNFVNNNEGSLVYIGELFLLYELRKSVAFPFRSTLPLSYKVEISKISL